jgi:hypothetical protein
MVRNALLLACLFGCVHADVVSATPILDQSLDQNGSNLFQNNSFAQTFTVGITGILTSVEVELQDFSVAPPSLTIAITNTVLGAPAFPPLVLGSTALATSGLTTAETWVAGTGLSIPVTAGDLLAIVITLSNKTGWVNGPDVYAGGMAFNAFGGAWLSFDNIDRSFRTFVEPAPAAVPEPASMFLLGLGLAGFWASRKHRRRSS